MNPATNPRSKTRIFLIILLVLLGLGGFFGGCAMLIDPSGESIGLPSNLLDGLPFSSFLLPGLFLVVVMGFAPSMFAWGLWKARPWAWKGALAQSIILILWICFQIFLWGKPIALQVVYLLWGILMLGLCFVPGVKPSEG
jgi:hypothetical protein